MCGLNTNAMEAQATKENCASEARDSEAGPHQSFRFCWGAQKPG